MRLGCCGSLDQIDVLKDVGFDFIEVGIQPVLRGSESDETWAATAPDPARLALPIEAANSLVPGNMPIVGPARDFPALKTYMERVARRARQLGIARLVFGSGGARKRPENVDAETAAAHLHEFAAMGAEIMHAQGVILVIEHLNKGETNTLNSLADCTALCEAVDHPGLQMLVDSYHYGLEKESDEALLDIGSRLRHVHVAEPIDRIEPGGHGPGSDKSFDFETFFCLLQKINYDERISFEGKWSGPIPEIGPVLVRRLRQWWENVNCNDRDV